MGKSFGSSYVAPSFRGMLSVRLVIKGTIVVIVSLITPLLLDALTLQAPVVNLAMCISAVDDVAQVSVILITPSVVLLRWSETAGLVPMRTLSMVKLLAPYFTVTVENRVNHGCCVQHRLELLYMRIDFFIVFRKVGCELVNEHSQGQGIVGRRVVDLFTMVLDTTDFLSD
jgi:hypothetical protein